MNTRFFNLFCQKNKVSVFHFGTYYATWINVVFAIGLSEPRAQFAAQTQQADNELL